MIQAIFIAKYATDVLIIGGGLAGLCAAISSASDHSKTMIVTKTLVGAATTTSVATGIISDATQYGDPEDSFEKHCEDTLADGAGVNDKALAKTMANDASKYFSKLIELGVEFDVESGPRQVFIPGHSKPRSDYMKDKGVMLQKALAKAIILATGGPGEMYSRIPLMLRVAQMRVS